MIVIAAFMAANGHTSIAMLYAVAIAAPARFITRKRSTRACMSETTTSTEPVQPMTSSQFMPRA